MFQFDRYLKQQDRLEKEKKARILKLQQEYGMTYAELQARKRLVLAVLKFGNQKVC